MQQADPYQAAPQAISNIDPTNLLMTTMLAEQIPSLTSGAATAMPGLLNLSSQSGIIPPFYDSTAGSSLLQDPYAGSTTPILDPLSLQGAYSDPSQQMYGTSVADAGITGGSPSPDGGIEGEPYSIMGGADPYNPSSNFVGTGGFGAGEAPIDFATNAPSVIIGDDGGSNGFEGADGDDDDDDDGGDF